MTSSLQNWVSSLQLKENDIVFFAANLGGMAKKIKLKGENFSVDLFIETFQNALPHGTIVVPAYTDHLKTGDTFDREKSKPTTGAISNKVQRRKDFKRTSDPLHSVFVWGKRADEILSLNDESTFGKQSVFGFLHRENAKMVIVDEHFQNSFTFVHYVEEQCKVKYRKYYQYTIQVILNGVSSLRKVLFYTRKIGTINDANDLQQVLLKNKTVTLINFEDINVQVMDLKETYQAIEKYLSEGNRVCHFSLLAWTKGLVKLILRRS